MKRKVLLKHLKKYECVLLKEGGRHSKWINIKDSRGITVIPRHNEIDNILAQEICKQLRIPIINR